MTYTADQNSEPYVLMIEDDRDDRYITETVLAETSYDIRIEFLPEGDHVVDYLSLCLMECKRFPAIIILDKNLPVYSGLDMLRALKSHPEFRHIPVVMISGTAFPSEVEESYRCGANAFMQKPDGGRLTVDRIRSFADYWFGIVDLPAQMPYQDRQPTLTL